MANISEVVDYDILEKLPDGTFKKKHPETKARQVLFEDGSTVESHKADYANYKKDSVVRKVSSLKPTANDDITKGYKQGDIWIYESYVNEDDYNYKVYVCIDNKVSIAKWELYIDKTGIGDFTGSPGPIKLIAGDMNAGYFGVVPSSELFTGTELAGLCGITEGTSQFSSEGWLKFVIDGRIIFKSQKSYRHGVSWNHINSMGCVKGTKQVVKNGIIYKARLMKGALTDPSINIGGDLGAKGSEWNRLMLPIHIKAKDKSWEYLNQVETSVPYWGIDFTDEDLHLKHTNGVGTVHWCQEVYGSEPLSRICRGMFGVEHLSYNTASTPSSHGWSPILEVVE